MPHQPVIKEPLFTICPDLNLKTRNTSNEMPAKSEACNSKEILIVFYIFVPDEKDAGKHQD